MQQYGRGARRILPYTRPCDCLMPRDLIHRVLLPYEQLVTAPTAADQQHSMRVWMVLLGEGRRQANRKRDEEQTREGRPHRMSAAQISGQLVNKLRGI